MQLVNTYYIGQMNDKVLIATLGLSQMLLNVFCFAITNGLNSALETLVSQAYGYGRFEVCGTYLYRGRVIVSLLIVFVGLLLS